MADATLAKPLPQLASLTVVLLHMYVIMCPVNCFYYYMFTQYILLVCTQTMQTSSLNSHDSSSHLQSIPPVTRMAMGRGTWVTVLCRKLRDWWHWVCY
jgi:hypothetical protein